MLEMAENQSSQDPRPSVGGFRHLISCDTAITIVVGETTGSPEPKGPPAESSCQGPLPLAVPGVGARLEGGSGPQILMSLDPSFPSLNEAVLPCHLLCPAWARGGNGTTGRGLV